MLTQNVQNKDSALSEAVKVCTVTIHGWQFAVHI